MSGKIARKCPKCHKFLTVEIEGGKFSCPNCTEAWGEVKADEDVFNRCPICTCRQFYVTKEFNQFLGCLILGLGIVLVPITFGLSLPVFAAVDWMLYKRVKSIIVCYRCACEFIDFRTNKKFKPFMHHIGLKYDKYR